MRIKKYFICFFVALILCFISAVLCNYSAGGYDIFKNASNVPIFESGEIKESGVYVDENNFPDDIFRNWIQNGENLDGAGSDGFLSYEEIGNIKDITIRGTSDNSIKDLKGVEFFTELTTLSVPYNSLTSLDLKYNNKITYLNCSYNKLEKINIRGLDSLISFNCEFNYLKSLDLTDNVSLTVLYCRHNLLENLDLSNNTELVFIETFDNMLTEIDVSMLEKLEFLHIDHNKLTFLDMSKNFNLKGGGFVVRNNYMERLVLPDIEDFTVYYDDFAEQDPIKGYERSLWYEDEDFTSQITSDLKANGQTLYVRRIPNSYTVYFNSEGADNVPQDIKTFYDEEFSIPDKIPSKRGYKFLYWSDDKYSDKKTYYPGQSVSNLSGARFDGEKTTLYAKWQGIEYTVRFDKNSEDATGTMENVNAVYGKISALPLNLYRRKGYDFEGWSLKKDGNVVFKDGQSFSDLSFLEGEIVTLYAVWSLDALSLQQPYLDLLKSELDILDENFYYDEDMKSLLSVYDNAAEDIKNSGKNTSLMSTVSDKAIKEMNNIPTKEDRAAEIAQIWRENNTFALKCVNTAPIPDGMAEEYMNAVGSALGNAEISELSKLSSLTETGNKAEAATDASIIIKEETENCKSFVKAAKWLIDAEKLAFLPLKEILPDHINSFSEISAIYESFSETEKNYVSYNTLYELNVRERLSYSKKAGIEKLNSIYEQAEENVAWQQSADKIKDIIEKAGNMILFSESEKEINDTIQNTEENIKAIFEDKHDVPETPEEDIKEENTENNFSQYMILSVIIASIAIICVFVFISLRSRKINKQN